MDIQDSLQGAQLVLGLNQGMTLKLSIFGPLS